jgi:ribose-phosphate pyrophosphokinase
MNTESLSVFALNATRTFAEGVAARLGIPLSAHEEREFEDGEHKARPLVSVRGKDVFVIQSLYSDDQESVNDKLCRLLFFAGALRDASAQRVSAVIPYLGYARKDRKTQPRDPVTTRYVASLIETVGIGRVITLEVHNLAAFQNAFRCRTEHLDANNLFVNYLASTLSSGERVAVVSPDVGGIKRAERFRQVLTSVLEREPTMAFLDKTRAKGTLSLGRVTGEVADRVVVIIDDLISTGSTLLHAAKVCKDNGAKRVYAVATHGVFVGDANRLLAGDELERIIVTDSIVPFRLEPELAKRKLVILSTADLFAQAIQRIHTGGSLVELLVGRSET